MAQHLRWMGAMNVDMALVGGFALGGQGHEANLRMYASTLRRLPAGALPWQLLAPANESALNGALMPGVIVRYLPSHDDFAWLLVVNGGDNDVAMSVRFSDAASKLLLLPLRADIDSESQGACTSATGKFHITLQPWELLGFAVRTAGVVFAAPVAVTAEVAPAANGLAAECLTTPPLLATPVPSAMPTPMPTSATKSPTKLPTPLPTSTLAPTALPTALPTKLPTRLPTPLPTIAPPTPTPTVPSPTPMVTLSPTRPPTGNPTASPPPPPTPQPTLLAPRTNISSMYLPKGDPKASDSDEGMKGPGVAASRGDGTAVYIGVFVAVGVLLLALAIAGLACVLNRRHRDRRDKRAGAASPERRSHRSMGSAHVSARTSRTAAAPAARGSSGSGGSGGSASRQRSRSATVTAPWSPLSVTSSNAIRGDATQYRLP